MGGVGRSVGVGVGVGEGGGGGGGGWWEGVRALYDPRHSYGGVHNCKRPDSSCSDKQQNLDRIH